MLQDKYTSRLLFPQCLSMAYTSEQLLSFTDAQIIEIFAPKLESFLHCWMNSSHHPQALYEWYYDEVVKDSISEHDKNGMLKSFTDDGHNDERYNSYDKLMQEKDYLEEDVAQWYSEEENNVHAFILYSFKYMVNGRGINTLRWITEFMNGE